VLGPAALQAWCYVSLGPSGTAALDAVLAAAVALIAAYVLASIEAARGVWGSLVALVLTIAVASVVLAHLARRVFPSSH